MKKKIIEKLSTKFTGVSENVLDRIAAKLAKTIKDESEIDDAVEKVTIQTLLDSYGDSRATEAQQTAVANYEKKYNLKDGKTIEEGGAAQQQNQQTQQQQQEEIPAWAKQMIEDNKNLKNQLATMNAEKTTTSRRARLDAIVSKLPEQFRAPYARIDVSSFSDEDFEKQIEGITAEVDGLADSFKTKGAIFGSPRNQAARGFNQNEDVPKEILDVLDAQSKNDPDAQNF